MILKMLGASGCGIDAGLVEVEVVAGSARMNDFNAVGCPTTR
jgi:hypothetical protein